MKLSSLLAVAALSLSALAGCQSDDSSVEADESDLTQGGSCAYSGPANELYKQAVELSKRYQTETCEVLQYEVFALAQEAVEACPAVGNLIATSQWAGALRTTLGPLQVADFAGQLQGKKGFDLSELGIAFDAGQTFWSPSVGAYGSWQIMHFGAGRYETETLVMDENDDIVRRVTDEGSFAFSSGAAGEVILNLSPIKEPPRELVFERYVDDYDGAKYFRLSPIEGSSDPDNRTDQLFNIHIGECDA